MKEKWRSHKYNFIESLEYLKGRKEGSIKSILTPWSKFNDATTDGIEWNSITIIAGRPGSGKTLIKDQIVRESFKLNKDQNFRILEFQFEMVGRVTAIRAFSSYLGKTYKHLCSADGEISQIDLDTCEMYARKFSEYPIDIVDEPITVNEIESVIDNYMKKHVIKNEDGSFEYTKTIITLDHSILVKKAAFEKDKFDTLYNLGEMLTKLKKKYPIAFIILSQLNRNIDHPDRNENGKVGNYITSGDIFGSDALYQHADTVVGINRPAKANIRFYGPDKYIITDDSILVMHFLKCRNGDTRMSFFKAQFEKMKIVETPTPSTK